MLCLILGLQGFRRLLVQLVIDYSSVSSQDKQYINVLWTLVVHDLDGNYSTAYLHAYIQLLNFGRLK